MLTKSAVPVTLFVGLLGITVSAMIGCSQRAAMPREGDTVAPRLVQNIKWRPGEEGELWVELTATADGEETRSLSFAASPQNNPVAEINFFAADGQPIGSERVEIAERC